MRSLWSTQLLWVLCLVAQLCPALCDPRGCSPPSSSVHGGPPGKKTGVGCHASSRGSSRPRDWTCVSSGSCTAGRLCTCEATRWPLIQQDWSPYKKRGFGHRLVHSGDTMQRLELCRHSLALPEARRDTWNTSFPGTFEGSRPFDLELLASRIERINLFISLI